MRAIRSMCNDWRTAIQLILCDLFGAYRHHSESKMILESIGDYYHVIRMDFFVSSEIPGSGLKLGAGW